MILAGAIFAAAAYLIFSIGVPANIPFAVAEYVLLGSIFIMMFDSLVEGRDEH